MERVEGVAEGESEREGVDWEDALVAEGASLQTLFALAILHPVP